MAETNAPIRAHAAEKSSGLPIKEFMLWLQGGFRPLI